MSRNNDDDGDDDDEKTSSKNINNTSSNQKRNTEKEGGQEKVTVFGAVQSNKKPGTRPGFLLSPVSYLVCAAVVATVWPEIPISTWPPFFAHEN
jgi:hypothetical protein